MFLQGIEISETLDIVEDTAADTANGKKKDREI